MTPQELKNSILQLAIQGKLVEQRPEEGTAQELVNRIKINQNMQIKTKQAKICKKIEQITDDVTPFEIPDSWTWIRFGNLVNYVMGKTPPRAESEWWNGNIPWVSISDMPESGHVKQTKEYITEVAVKDKFGGRISPAGTLLMSFKLTVGRVSILDIEAVHNEAIISIYPFYDENHINQTFLFYILPFISQFGDSKNAIKGKTLNDTSISNLLIPLPPLAEQKRIVAKIEELLPLVDRYEQAWTKLEDFNRRFPEDMKKSILQQAIQGKLVEQRPEEGTAQELYAQIQAEKRRLIKEGKLKKEKPLPEITEEEKPFEIPEGWMWVRLGTLTEAITSGSRDWAKYYSKTGDIFLRMGNLSKNSFDLRLDKIQRVTIPESTEGKRTSLQAGDLLFSITGDVGMLGLIPPDFGVAYINQHTAMLRFMEKERNRYIPYLLLTDYAQKFYNGNQHGIKNSFRLDSIAWLPVPLPPLAEQKRIVEKLEELLARCERLKKKRT